jgi:two-component system, NtrC family, response regulator HydG
MISNGTEPEQPQAGRARFKLLVADDDEGVRAGLVANLELDGYQVVEARDGAEAIQLLDQQAFDLIISDVVMPLATGVDVLSAVRKRGSIRHSS